MSALTKKHPTEPVAKISWHGKLYVVPVKIMEQYAIDETSDNAHTSIDEVFSGLIQKTGEPGLLLRGLRYREGLSQIQFAQKLGVTQTNLSAIENGRRTIGKELAKRIGGIFDTDYRLFL